MLSIITCIYNGEKYIAECLDELLKINFINTEIIIVNDGSVDQTAEICEGFAKLHSNIKLFNKENTGLPDSRNFGLMHSSGEYLLFVDIDDIIDLKGVNVCLEILQRQQNVDFVVGEVEYFGDVGEGWSRLSRLAKRVLRPNNINLKYQIFINNYFVTPGAFLFRRNVFDKIGSFNQKLTLGEDWDFFCRAFLLSNYHTVTDKVLNYRIHNQSMSTNLAGNRKAIILLRKLIFKTLMNDSNLSQSQFSQLKIKHYQTSRYFLIKKQLSSGLKFIVTEHLKLAVRTKTNFLKNFLFFIKHLCMYLIK